jgi:DNA-binding response OmpR family regulator
MFSPTHETHLHHEEQEMPRSHANIETANNSQQLILLVEDNTDSSTMLKTLLELWNYRVIEAHDGAEAVELARKESPNLILMDVKIPVIDGVEATRRIRQFASAEKMPVVYISGHTQPGFRMVALASGGNDYLIKPIDFKDLEAMLNKYIRKKKPTDESGFLRH